MNPKEKAKELVDKFFKPELSHLLYGVLKYDEAKQCAIIEVKDIIEMLEKLWSKYSCDCLHLELSYYEKVLTEIENL
jgi:hypothetical protein